MVFLQQMVTSMIYAFSFNGLIRNECAYPTKTGETANDLEKRIISQCKGSAIFDNPTILGSWRVNRVGFVEQAIHKVLAARGKWRSSVPGTEWFDTTVEEVRSIIEFTGCEKR
jgi:T5orf172 domain